MQVRQIRDIQYHLLPGTDRKTTDIVIERNGTVTVRPPKRFSPDQVDQTVLAKRMWIYRSLAEWRELNASRVRREWVNGESFLYLGKHYRLEWVDTEDETLRLKNGHFLLARSLLLRGGIDAARQAFVDFYARKGHARLVQRVAHYAPKVGVQPGALEVRELGTRWATCSAAGKLAFHWKSLMAPQTVLDYLVVHELCHLHHRDHSAAFWNEVDKVLPDHPERIEWLRVHGAALDV